MLAGSSSVSVDRASQASTVGGAEAGDRSDDEVTLQMGGLSDQADDEATEAPAASAPVEGEVLAEASAMKEGGSDDAMEAVAASASAEEEAVVPAPAEDREGGALVMPIQVDAHWPHPLGKGRTRMPTRIEQRRFFETYADGTDEQRARLVRNLWKDWPCALFLLREQLWVEYEKEKSRKRYRDNAEAIKARKRAKYAADKRQRRIQEWARWQVEKLWLRSKLVKRLCDGEP